MVEAPASARALELVEATASALDLDLEFLLAFRKVAVEVSLGHSVSMLLVVVAIRNLQVSSRKGRPLHHSKAARCIRFSLVRTYRGKD